MTKTASVTVRIPDELKRRIAQRAKREHRSVSSQIEHELDLAFRDEPNTRLAKTGTLFGRYAGTPLPTEEDLREVRNVLWTRLKSTK